MSYSKKAWIIWGAATLLVAFQLFINILFGMATKEISMSYSVTANDVSKVIAVYTLVYACMQIPAGLILDKFSVKYVLFVGAILITAPLFLLGTAHSLSMAYLAAVIMGAGSSFSFVGAVILNARWFPPKMFSVATGLTSGTNGLIAALIGFLIVSIIPSLAIANSQIIISGFIGIIITIMILLLIKDYPKGVKLDKVDTAPENKKNIWKGIYVAICNRQIVLAALMTALVYGSMLAFYTFWNIQYQQLYGLSAKTTSLISIVCLAGIAIGAPLSGWVSEKIGKRKPVGYGICIGLFICLIIVLQPVDLSTPVVFVVMFFLGLFSNNVSIGFSLIKENSDPHFVGTAIAFANTILFLGMSLLNVVPGALMPYFYKNHHLLIASYLTKDLSAMSMAHYSFLVAVVVAFICLLFIKETNCKPIALSQKIKIPASVS
ncbi:MAG TPA: MFS transporter [Victivallales bacterium]|nr:MFS transporter [Victivallales bacterium]